MEQQMRFCVEIRLTNLEWELGLGLAQLELAKHEQA